MPADKRVVTIVLTGGPCAGKSSAACWVKKTAKHLGWTTFFMSETATQILEAGVERHVCQTAELFQEFVLDMQIAREERYLAMARAVPSPEVLVVFDRGVLDGEAYVGREALDALMEKRGLSREKALARYDAVIHLESAAKGRASDYTTTNNPARAESAPEAAAADDRVREAWSEHPQLRIVGARDDFEEKMDELAAILKGLLE